MKKVLTVLFTTLFLTLNAYAYELVKESLKVQWTAYKTPAKAGVSGTFDDLLLKQVNTKAKNLPSLLINTEVVIKGQNVNSNNKGRDMKLSTFFFNNLAGLITAKIIKVDNKRLELLIKMNNIRQKVPMSYTLENGTLSAKGFIDIFDFSGHKALKAINKACYELHEGKTWSDVSIEFWIDIKK